MKWNGMYKGIMLLGVLFLCGVVLHFLRAWPSAPVDWVKVVIFSAIGIGTFHITRALLPVHEYKMQVDYTSLFITLSALIGGMWTGILTGVACSFLTNSVIRMASWRKQYGLFVMSILVVLNISLYMLVAVLMVLMTSWSTTLPAAVHAMVIMVAALGYDLFSMYCVLAYRALVMGAEGKKPDLSMFRVPLEENSLYYVYTSACPVIFLFLYQSLGYFGIVLLLCIMIPSQRTGLLYMQLMQKQKQLFTDELTGLANANHFRHEVEQLRKRQQEYYVMMIDMDRFKTINDSYGHQAGNEALVAFSRFMEHALHVPKRCIGPTRGCTAPNRRGVGASLRSRCDGALVHWFANLRAFGQARACWHATGHDSIS